MTDFVQRRLAKAAEFVEAARLLRDEGFEDSAADRAYYAMFYAVEALLAARNQTYSSHGAVHGAFGRLFAKTGELDPRYHRWLIHAFEGRQSATYGTDIESEPDRESVTRVIDQAEELLAAAKAYLSRGND